MSEPTSRDEAVRVGAEAIQGEYPHLWAHEAMKHAKWVLDADHKAGLISYQDEWEEVRSYGQLAVHPGELYRRVRRVSFEAGEEVNEEHASTSSRRDDEPMWRARR